VALLLVGDHQTYNMIENNDLEERLGASGGLGRSDSLKTGSVSPWLFTKPAKTTS
jgi:hypothetical protein